MLAGLISSGPLRGRSIRRQIPLSPPLAEGGETKPTPAFGHPSEEGSGEAGGWVLSSPAASARLGKADSGPCASQRCQRGKREAQGDLGARRALLEKSIANGDTTLALVVRQFETEQAGVSPFAWRSPPRSAHSALPSQRLRAASSAAPAVRATAEKKASDPPILEATNSEQSCWGRPASSESPHHAAREKTPMNIYSASTIRTKSERGLTNPPGRDNCPQPTAHSPQPTAHSPQPTAHSPQPTAHSPQPTAHSPQPTAHSPQPTAHSPQPTAHSPQPTAHSPQPTAHSPQPTAHSPQPTAHSPQPTAHSPQPGGAQP